MRCRMVLVRGDAVRGMGDEPLLHLGDQIALPRGETAIVEAFHHRDIEPSQS